MSIYYFNIQRPYKMILINIQYQMISIYNEGEHCIISKETNYILLYVDDILVIFIKYEV